MRRLIALAALLGALLVPVGQGLAVTVDEIARDVRCPTCNTTLNTSDAPVARAMKADIAERIERGESRQEILDALVAQFGEDILATPSKSGFDLVAWVIPGAAIGGGLVAIVILSLSWSRRRTTTPDIEVSPQEAARLERELGRLPD